MPYIVTTKPLIAVHRAVATLAEAQVKCWEAWGGEGQAWEASPARIQSALALVSSQISEMAVSGGSVGPLPDGMTITIEPVSYARLGLDLSEMGISHPLGGFSDKQMLAAYNAKQATA